MPDQANQEVAPATRRTMQANRGRDTGPELAIRSVLHSRGLRFRVNQPLPFDRRRRADLTFPKVGLYVFVDGCFWHKCPEHFVEPKTRAEFWLNKINGNYRRDVDTRQRLEESGATVVRIWEHTDPHQAADQVEQVYRLLVSTASRTVSSSDHC
jgi:DNA mismatch endonuclease (patch repair protein)